MLTLDVIVSEHKLVTWLSAGSDSNTKRPLDGAVLQITHAVWAFVFDWQIRLRARPGVQCNCLPRFWSDRHPFCLLNPEHRVDFFLPSYYSRGILFIYFLASNMSAKLIKAVSLLCLCTVCVLTCSPLTVPLTLLLLELIGANWLKLLALVELALLREANFRNDEITFNKNGAEFER